MGDMTPSILTRLEEGGSRELDFALREMFGAWMPLKVAGGFNDGCWVRKLGDALIDIGSPRDSGIQATDFYVPRYTTSVDAALALAERLGWGNAYCLDAACQTTHKAQPTAHIWSDEGKHTGHARTMPAAICIAILKAKALQDGRDG